MPGHNHAAKEPRAGLVEIFSSFQGEGIFLGVKQVFIRFAECNLGCLFCDTSKIAVIKDVSVEDIMKKVLELEGSSGGHHSISLTGGEPLLHADFLEYLIPELKNAGFGIYLETNGTLTKELKRVIGRVDIIAMDMKLPSSTGLEPFWESHTEFLRTAKQKNVFIKVVITGNTSEYDIIKACSIVEEIDKNIFFVLQPINPVRYLLSNGVGSAENGDFTVAKDKILNYSKLAGESLKNVRIVPQMHKLLGIK